MGFFSKLVDSVTHAADWVANNSGTIGNVIAAVAKVAGPLALAADEKDGVSAVSADDQSVLDMPTFINTMNQASDALVAAAQSSTSTLALPKSLSAGGGTQTITSEDTYSGLWVSPAMLDKNGNPSSGMSQDLSSMLDMMGFPQSITGPDGKPLNVSNAIGATIFANAPPIPTDSTTFGEDGNPYATVGFTFPSQDNSMVIQGTHAYYGIPLGEAAGDTTAWHCAVHLKTVMTQNAKKTYLQQKAALQKVTVRQSVDPKGVGVDLVNVWVVAVKIFWATAPYAVKLAPLLFDILTGANQNYSIEVNTLTGNVQLLRIQAFSGNPAQVREAVSTAVNNAINGQAPTQSISAPETGLTDVQVISSTIAAVPKPSPAPSSSSLGAKGSAKGTSLTPKHSSHVNGGVKNGRISFKPFGEIASMHDIDGDATKYFVPLFPFPYHTEVDA